MDCSSVLTSEQKKKTGCLRGNDKKGGGKTTKWLLIYLSLGNKTVFDNTCMV